MLAPSNGPTKYMSPTPHLRTGTDPVSEKFLSLMLFRIMDNGETPKTK
jgi:hypothetical protein